MKNFTLALNIILTIAVGVLFYLHFADKTKVVAKSTTQANTMPTTLKVAYFEMDSIENQFLFIREINKTIVSKEQEVNGTLGKLQNDYVAAMESYQKNAASMTEENQRNEQKKIMLLEKKYNNQKQMGIQELQEIRFKNQQLAVKKIQDYLKEYSKTRNFSFIFSNSSDINFLSYKDTMYNITPDVIKGLNEDYTKKK